MTTRNYLEAQGLVSELLSKKSIDTAELHNAGVQAYQLSAVKAAMDTAAQQGDSTLVRDAIALTPNYDDPRAETNLYSLLVARAEAGDSVEQLDAAMYAGLDTLVRTSTQARCVTDDGRVQVIDDPSSLSSAADELTLTEKIGIFFARVLVPKRYRERLDEVEEVVRIISPVLRLTSGDPQVSDGSQAHSDSEVDGDPFEGFYPNNVTNVTDSASSPTIDFSSYSDILDAAKQEVAREHMGQLESLTRQLVDKTQRVEDLQEELAARNRDYNEVSRSLLETGQDLERQRREISTLEARVALADSKNATLTGQNSRLLGEALNYVAQITGLTDERDRARTSVGELRAQKTNVVKRYNDLVAKYRQDVGVKDKKIQELDGQVSDLNDQLKEARANYTTTQEDLTRTQGELASYRTKADTQYGQLERDFATKTQEYLELVDDFEKLEEEHGTALARIRNLQERLLAYESASSSDPTSSDNKP